ncbi:MAG: S41 family peptidase [Bacteroidales bacterium]|nr:S41 family peptidase [Clostridium sp.]MCM1202774.1 S41 family peptidase [Bacteroidales bacterium]
MIYEDLAFIILETVFAAGLYLLAGYATKALSPKWRLCYAVPLIVCFLAIAAFGFEKSLLSAYLGTGILLVGFVKDAEKPRKAASATAGIGILLSAVICSVYPGYRSPDYVKDFNRGFAEMKAHYVLTEQKGINWDELYAEYLPRFEAADKAHDKVEICLAWNDFAMEFHDGHVAYSAKDENTANKALEKLCGNDYGLSLITMTDGRTAAVNVEEKSAVSAAGIHNGTVITAWDGVPIDEAVENAEETAKRIRSYACRENEEFYRPLMAAGAGGDSVTISYIDENGSEQTVTAPKLGSYVERLKMTMEILDKGVEISNLEWQEVDDKTALLRMRFMAYDAKENYGEMEKEIREKLLELKEAGITNLIFDLRSNAGGSGTYVEHIVKLIAPEGEHLYAYDGVLDLKSMKYKKDDASGAYIKGEAERYRGENMWADGKIIILVNAQTISAGDHFSRIASAFPNVTIMGFTHSNCSGQGVHGIEFDYGELDYSAALLLEEDGTVFLDTDKSGEATVPLDVQIPFDETAIKMMFDEGEDYVLWYARNYLE